LVLEALRAAYPWASDRLHAFVLAGMKDNAAAFARRGVLYHPYVEPAPDDGKGLLAALSRHACVVVTDDFPCFFLPRMVIAAARQVRCRMEQVDSNGLLPMRAAGREFRTAFSFRRFLQRHLLTHLDDMPREDPLRGARLPRLAALPGAIASRWKAAGTRLLEGRADALAALPIDHGVPVSPVMAGGSREAGRLLDDFLDRKLDRYPDRRSRPAEDGTSRLSPSLHFGHVAAHEVFAALARRESWSADRLRPDRATGSKGTWWGMSAAAEAFLDELVTWRELAFNLCCFRRDYDRYTAVPDWARRTLEAHAADPRPHRYTLRQMEAADTHDPIWNAAQTQMAREGWFHNQMRMLWGKKILEWSPTPRSALDAMARLMGRHALDGRNPASWAGYLWVLGRYDRPWGPERPIFGTVRYMSSDSMARKTKLRPYLERYGGSARAALPV
jgi:deoxyribodipyrimidine photo-lyase